MIRALVITALAAAATPAAARDPILNPPIACTLGEDCFIQNHVDADGGPGAADFTCGSLSYDGHKGTDFALPSLAAMAAGVDVLAAAPGRVKALRDGEPDHAQGTEGAPDVSGRECGNGVVIDHGGGWETQYCHLARGSIAVETGQRVALGTVLGQVGLSGATQFPHVHISVRKDGQVVDPFNPDGIVACGETDPDTLWQNNPGYVPGGIISAGFAPGVPGYDDVKAGNAMHETLAGDGPALVGWAYVFGARAGDVLGISIALPAGASLIEKEIPLDRTQAQLFRAIGRKTPPGGWPSGVYLMDVRLTRDGAVVDQAQVSVPVN